MYVVESLRPFDLTVHCGSNHQANEVTTHTGAILVSMEPGCVGQTYFGRFMAAEVVAQATAVISPGTLDNNTLSNLEILDDQMGNYPHSLRTWAGKKKS